MNTSTIEATQSAPLGILADLAVCKAQGLFIVDTYGQNFDRRIQYRVYAYYPEIIRFHPEHLRLDVRISWEDLRDLYVKHKVGIDSIVRNMGDLMYKLHPTFNDFLLAANHLHSYCGID